MQTRPDLRNVAIIAHVDHGKTTLVDAMLWQGGIFRANETVPERIMDSIDLEREKGITIMAKNTAITYRGMKINIVDTPGHADFGGEVERTLTLVDGVLLLVDAAEGPAAPDPLRAARRRSRPGSRRWSSSTRSTGPTPARSRSWTRSTTSSSTSTPTRASSTSRCSTPTPAGARPPRAWTSRAGRSSRSSRPCSPRCPPPRYDPAMGLQLRAASLDWDDYVGRLVIGRVTNGTIRATDRVAVVRRSGAVDSAKITVVYVYEGLRRVEVPEAGPGEVVAVAGIEAMDIGETLADPERPVALPPIRIDEPTVAMLFSLERLPVRRPRGQVRHLAAPARPPLQGGPHQRGDPDRGDGDAGHLPRVGSGRAPARDPDRDDAPRGLRARGRAARGDHPDGGRPAARADGAPRRRLPRGVHRRGDPEGRARAAARWSR